MSKLRNTHNKYKRCKNDGITYRGPIGVCTRTTPPASFSINIPGPAWEPEIGQSNSRAAIIALWTVHWKPYFNGLGNILAEKLQPSRAPRFILEFSASSV